MEGESAQEKRAQPGVGESLSDQVTFQGRAQAGECKPCSIYVQKCKGPEAAAVACLRKGKARAPGEECVCEGKWESMSSVSWLEWGRTGPDIMGSSYPWQGQRCHSWGALKPLKMCEPTGALEGKQWSVVGGCWKSPCGHAARQRPGRWPRKRAAAVRTRAPFRGRRSRMCSSHTVGGRERGEPRKPLRRLA